MTLSLKRDSNPLVIAPLALRLIYFRDPPVNKKQNKHDDHGNDSAVCQRFSRSQ